MKLFFDYLVSSETEAHYTIMKSKSGMNLFAISASTNGNSNKGTDGLYLYHCDANDRSLDRDKNGCLKIIGVDMV